MRLFFVIAFCKLLHFVGKRFGRGSSLPGWVALALYPGILKRMKLPRTTIAITGSNGKTTTTEMIAHTLEACGMRIGWNREGSNQIEGVATLLLRYSTFGGKVDRDALVLECDERYAQSIFKVFAPSVFVVTNICRDQLTRNGHPESVQDCIRAAIAVAGDRMSLALNADDPYVAALAAPTSPDGTGGSVGAAGSVGASTSASGADGTDGADGASGASGVGSSVSEIVSCKSGVNVAWFGISRNAAEQYADRTAMESNELPITHKANSPLSSVKCRHQRHLVLSPLSSFLFYNPPNAGGGMYDDGAFCPICKSRMKYEYRVAAHMGSYRCDACGHARPTPQVEAAAVDYETGAVTFGDGAMSRLAFPSLTGAYNLAAAIAAVGLAVGTSAEVAARILEGYALTGGRTVDFTVDDRAGMLLVSKHENSVSYNQSLAWVVGRRKPCTVVIVVDSISRKYYTSDTSWLWDIDFGILADSCINHIVLAGRYVNDLAARFALSAVNPSKAARVADLTSLRTHIATSTAHDIYALTCFSDKEKLLKALNQRSTI